MKKTLAWMWSIALSLQIAVAITGGTPTWISVFCPLSAIVVKCWSEVYLKGK